jgi:hypothetical protein
LVLRPAFHLPRWGNGITEQLAARLGVDPTAIPVPDASPPSRGPPSPPPWPDGPPATVARTGGFSKPADALGRQQERRRVTLVDVGQLFDLWVTHYERIAEPDRLLLPLKPVHFLALET